MLTLSKLVLVGDVLSVYVILEVMVAVGVRERVLDRGTSTRTLRTDPLAHPERGTKGIVGCSRV